MSYSTAQVKALREKSGTGILDCQKALKESNGNFEEALLYLKKKGLADAKERESRATTVGRIFTAQQDDSIFIAELLCETDFVVRNDTFIDLGNELAHALMSIESAEERLKQAEPFIQKRVSILKENITLRRHQRLHVAQNHIAHAYIHGDSGELGSMVVVAVENNATVEQSTIVQLAHDLALHCAAFRPLYVDRDAVPREYIDKQTVIYGEQAQATGKPENIQSGIVRGKLNKHFKEICFLDQPFIKDEKKSVHAVLTETSRAIGQTITIADYIVYRAGETI